MDEQDIIIDTQSISDAGFDGNLIRPVETLPSGELKYLDPNSFVGGTIGKMGVLYVGSKQIRIDARRGNMVWNDGTEDVVTLGKLSDGSFGIKVADGRIEGKWIVANSITADQIKGETITANEIAAGAITTEKLDAEAVTTAKLDAEAVTAEKISTGAVVAGKIAAGAINAANLIVDGTITAAKLSVTTLSAITANLGTITAGSISGTSITLPYEAAGAAGNFRWVNNNNKIWTDSSQYMGFKSAGGRFYFYANGTLQFYVDTSGTYSYDHVYIGAAQTNKTANLYVGSGSHQQEIYLNGYLRFMIDGPATPEVDSLYKNGAYLNYRNSSGQVYQIDMTGPL